MILPSIITQPPRFGESIVDRNGRATRSFIKFLEDIESTSTTTTTENLIQDAIGNLSQLQSYIAYINRYGMGGGFTPTYTGIGATYTVLSTDYVVDCTANTFTVTLLSASGIQGQEFEIKNSGSGIITVDASGSETIDGFLTQVLVRYDAMKIMSTGSNWIII